MRHDHAALTLIPPQAALPARIEDGNAGWRTGPTGVSSLCGGATIHIGRSAGEHRQYHEPATAGQD